ncbi:MAG: hypothetical protein RDU89_07430 [bacterium]|nr:hypothetical protein [bacterium]
MTYSLVVDRTLVLTLFFGVLGLVFALGVLNLIQVAVLAARGLYKPPKHLVGWSIRYSRVREGLRLLVVGGVVAYGIHFSLGFWVTLFLVVAGVGLVQVLTGLAGRYHHCR